MDDKNERIEPGLMRRVLARIGRKGGQAKSERKTLACRANAKLPRKRNPGAPKNKTGAFGKCGRGGLKRKLTRRAKR
jgi:hypothetical protein